MKKRIRVTDGDIARGRPGEANECPLALAIKRGFATDGYVSVSNHLASIDLAWGIRCATLSPRAQVFVRQFDRGRTVRPTTFMLNFE